jgi:hypothetical protein
MTMSMTNDTAESPFGDVDSGEVRAAAANQWGAFSVETFASADPLTHTHEDAQGWLDYLDDFTPFNFWLTDANVKVWAYEEDFDAWDGTYGMDAVLAVYHSGHGVMLGDGRFAAPLGADWGGLGTWAYSDRMRLGNEQARYIWWSTCESLRVHGGHNPIRTWSPANLGFRMLFGYETVSVDDPDYGRAFWRHWNDGKSLSTAFMDASWYDISTHQAPSVVACGATAEEATDRLYNERYLTAAPASTAWWQWRWYDAAPEVGSAARFEAPSELLVGRMRQPVVDERYANRVRAALDVPVMGSLRAMPSRLGAGPRFAAAEGQARFAVESDGSYDVAFRAPNRENRTPLATSDAVRAADDFAAVTSLGVGDLTLDKVVHNYEAGGTVEGDGELTEPAITETVVQYTQRVNGVPVLSPGRGQLSVTIDNDGTVVGVRDTTREVVELTDRRRRSPGSPGAPGDPGGPGGRGDEPDLSPAGLRRRLDDAWRTQMVAFLLRGGLPTGYAEVPGSAEVGYVVRGGEAVLVARREVQIDAGYGLSKRYKVEVPLAQ